MGNVYSQNAVAKYLENSSILKARLKVVFNFLFFKSEDLVSPNFERGGGGGDPDPFFPLDVISIFITQKGGPEPLEPSPGYAPDKKESLVFTAF